MKAAEPADLKESVDSVRSRTLFREEDEGNDVHANIYVLTEMDTVGSKNTLDHKVDNGPSDIYSEPTSSEHEVQIEFMHF